MVKSEKSPYGYIYRATNIQNDKNYIGQTVTSRWGDDKNPIEERWKEEVREAYTGQKRGENLRYVENAIIKYGPENFKLKEQDVAYSQKELDNKETHYINEYDSMNPDKGYNMKEGGLGGRLSEMAKENLSKIGKEKWQKDLEYIEKQTKERKERGKDSKFREKMTKINREKGKDPKFRENVSKAIKAKYDKDPEYSEKQAKERKERGKDPKFREKMTEINRARAQDPEYKEKMSKISKEKWKDPEYQRKQEESHKKFRKDIPDKEQFFKDIQNMLSKNIEKKYEMNRSTVNKRIREMLGDHGVKNYTEAKNYLANKNLDEVVKEIKTKLSDLSQKYEGKTTISNKRDFLKDVQNLQKNEIDHKYGMDAKTVNNKIKEMLGEHGVKNYTGAKEYLKDKNLDEVLKDIEKRSTEKQGDQQRSESNVEEKEKVQRTEQKEKSKSEEPTKGVAKEQQFESDFSPKATEQDMIDAKVREFNEREVKRVPKGSGFIDDWDYPVDERDLIRNDWDHLGPGSPTGGKDYQGILENSLNSSSGGNNDYEGITEGPKSEEIQRTEQKEENKSEKHIEEVSKGQQFEESIPLPKYSGGDSQQEPLGCLGINPEEQKENDYKGIDAPVVDSDSDRGNDYKGIDKFTKDDDKDYDWLQEDSKSEGKDFDGIDDSSGEGKTGTDYEKTDEEHVGSEHGGEG